MAGRRFTDDDIVLVSMDGGVMVMGLDRIGDSLDRIADALEAPRAAGLERALWHQIAVALAAELRVTRAAFGLATSSSEPECLAAFDRAEAGG